MTDHVAVEASVPDTGAIETDLREHARALVGWLTSPIGRAIMAAALSDAARVPEVADVKRRYFDDRFRRAQPVIARAIARGELPADTDPAELVKAMIAPIYLRLLVTADPIDETTADRAAQAALAGARDGLLRASAARHEGCRWERRRHSVERSPPAPATLDDRIVPLGGVAIDRPSFPSAEAAASRAWAGIHFPVDNDAGQLLGRNGGYLVANVAREDEAG